MEGEGCDRLVSWLRLRQVTPLRPEDIGRQGRAGELGAATRLTDTGRLQRKRGGVMGVVWTGRPPVATAWLNESSQDVAHYNYYYLA